MGSTGIHGVETIVSKVYILKGKKRIAIYWSDKTYSGDYTCLFEWKLAYESEEGICHENWKDDLGLSFLSFFHSPLAEKEP